MNILPYLLSMSVFLLYACNLLNLQEQDAASKGPLPPRPLQGIKSDPPMIPVHIQDKVISVDQYGNHRLQIKLSVSNGSWESLKYSLANFLKDYQTRYHVIWAEVQVGGSPISYFQLEWFSHSVPQHQRRSIISDNHESFRNIVFSSRKP